MDIKEQILRRVCKYRAEDSMCENDDITISEAMEAMEEYKKEQANTEFDKQLQKDIDFAKIHGVNPLRYYE